MAAQAMPTNDHAVDRIACSTCPRVRRRLAALLVLMVTSALAASDCHAQVQGATGVVERLQDTLVSVMKDAKTLAYGGRYARLAPVVKETHDLAGIARIAAGAYWQQLSDEQKALFVGIFTDLSIANYAYQFDDYSGERFKTDGTEPLSRGDVVVHATLTKSDGEQVRFDYVLRPADGQWRIVNIIVDGVSDLALKRAEYTSILKSAGFDALIAKLKGKIAEYSTKAD
jgi:phospholipid transport system substrate-binding protein